MTPTTNTCKSLVSTWITSTLVDFLWAEVHEHFNSILIAWIITFGPLYCPKMPLESHSQEAQTLLAAALISMLDEPQHWYAPMLPANHPSSFCQLLGLTEEELHHVMESSQFIVKWGKNGNVQFEGDAFHSLLSMEPWWAVQCNYCSWQAFLLY